MPSASETDGVVAIILFTCIALVIGGAIILINNDVTSKRRRLEAKKSPKQASTATHASVRANILLDQWRVLEHRMGSALVDEVEALDLPSWNPTGSSAAAPRRCLGQISLEMDNARDRKEMRPMPLLHENRTRLVELGFVISDDNLWAVFVDEAQ